MTDRDLRQKPGDAGAEYDWPSQLPAAFSVALAEFNRGDYYRCHETLEALWIPEKGAVRELYQGVLQIAVGCYHLTRRANRVGAVRLLDRGARRLEGVLAQWQRAHASVAAAPAASSTPASGDPSKDLYGVDWADLIAASDRLRSAIQRDAGATDELGTLHLEAFQALLPVIRTSEENLPLPPPSQGGG